MTSSPSVQLRYYQEEASQAVMDATDERKSRVVVSSPTGSGKTVLSADYTRRSLALDDTAPALTVVPWLDLVEQTREKYEQFFSPKDIGVVQGRIRQLGRRITVASLQTILLPGAVEQMLAAQRGRPYALVTFDECHHGTLTVAAQKLLERVVGPSGETQLVGLSATPTRADRKSLRRVFRDGLIYTVSPLELVLGGYLSDIRPYDIQTNFDPGADFSLDEDDDDDEDEDDTGGHKSEQQQQQQQQQRLLSPAQRQRLEKSNRYERGYTAWQHYTRGQQRTLIFAQDISDCYGWQTYFQQRGVACEVVTGQHGRESRRDIYARFASGQLKVIANYNVLTTGIDIPAIECILIARVMSRETFTQAIGRGMRLCPEIGKQFLTLLNLTDTHYTLSATRELTGTLTPDVPSVRAFLRAKLEREQQPQPEQGRDRLTLSSDSSLRSSLRELKTHAYNIFTGDGWVYHEALDLFVKDAGGALGRVYAEGEITGNYRVWHESAKGRRTWLGGSEREPVADALRARAIGAEHLEWRRAEQAKQRGEAGAAGLDGRIRHWQWQLLSRRKVPQVGKSWEEAAASGMTQADYYRLAELLKEHGSAWAAISARADCRGRVPKEQRAKEEKSKKAQAGASSSHPITKVS